ncbi:MAG: flagellar motor switch protein FliM [Syntrophaceae bacterium]|nr:flagellar motor switch protein FliM [Syntrophaceae bacterium]
MDKILNQEEIDALLKGIEGGKVEMTPEAKAESRVAPYDFANQDRIIRGRMQTLEMINDFFARNLRTPLSVTLRKNVEVDPGRILLTKFGEFTRSLSLPCSFQVFKMNPLRGQALLILDPNLVFSVVDIFLGGTGRTNFRVEGRDLTPIETKLIQKVVSIIFADLEKAWNMVHPFSFQHLRSEVNPQLASIVAPTELVLTIAFRLEVEQNPGFITLCIPYLALEPIKSKLFSGGQTEQKELDPTWLSRVSDGLKWAEVEVVVEFAKTVITSQNLLGLKAGDILLLGKEITEPLTAKIQGVPKFSGRAGVFGRNKAFQIEGTLKPA